MKSIRILIADDHPVVRAGLQGMLTSQPDFELVGEAASGTEAVTLSAHLHPDVVLMDLRMAEMDGAVATAHIQSQQPGTAVLILTTYDTNSDILRAIEAGATGYLLKDTPRDELFAAIRSVAQGKAVLAPTVATRLLRQRKTLAGEVLSARELEVLSLVARGASNREVARSLYLSEATVKSHLIHLFGKLGVTDRTAAVTVALQHGLLHLETE
jgi:DNA-binding NarL/FixJ family response regulator